MRPYFVFLAVVLIASAAFAQQPVPRTYGGGVYGFGPYVPLLTTPMMSLETVSPNPAGATNATTGLVAGATNSTLSELQGSGSSDHTVAVWYQGGAPLTTRDVNLGPEPIAREMRAMRGDRNEGPAPREANGPEISRHEGHRQWAYFTGSEHTTNLAAAAKGPGPGAHSYTNADVTRQNDKNGSVHYDGKTEKIQ